MADRDYYDILGVARDATQQEIKRAYRRAALEVHPDRSDAPDAEERFKELSEAYSVLGDPDTRARYDRFGRAGVGGAGQGFDASIFEEIFGPMSGAGGLEDLLAQMFGGRARQGAARGPRAARGRDLHYRLEIDFLEAAFGTTERIRLRRPEPCGTCGGSGAAEGGETTCATCRGSGHVAYRSGFMHIQRTCPGCRGQGRTITTPCSACDGAGRVLDERDVTVRVPAGVDEGVRLRVAGEGEGGARGGPAGDLYVDVAIRAHELFTRDGSDVHADLVVPFSELVLGGELEVPTVHGTETFDLPAGTVPGSRLRLRGKGVPRLDGRGQGDHVLRVVARPAKRLGREERELWERLRELERERSASEGEERTLFEKVRDLFTAD